MLRNSDGTLYQSGVHKIKLSTYKAETQEIVGKVGKDLVLHNCAWDEESSQDEQVACPNKESDLVIPDNVGELLAKPLPIITQEEEVVKPEITEIVPVVEIPASIPEPVFAEEPKKFDHLKLENKVVAHCLLAKKVSYKDDLYGEVTIREEWASKIIIEIIVIESNITGMTFWTNVEITKSSLIVPIKYNDGSRFPIQSCVKVDTVKPDTGGYIAKCFISATQPSF